MVFRITKTFCIVAKNCFETWRLCVDVLENSPGLANREERQECSSVRETMTLHLQDHYVSVTKLNLSNIFYPFNRRYFISILVCGFLLDCCVFICCFKLQRLEHPSVSVIVQMKVLKSDFYFNILGEFPRISTRNPLLQTAVPWKAGETCLKHHL